MYGYKSKAEEQNEKLETLLAYHKELKEKLNEIRETGEITYDYIAHQKELLGDALFKLMYKHNFIVNNYAMENQPLSFVVFYPDEKHQVKITVEKNDALLQLVDENHHGIAFYHFNTVQHISEWSDTDKSEMKPLYMNANEIIKKMEPCYMDAMIQRCQTKNDNLCAEIEMYADCKQYHKDEKIKKRITELQNSPVKYLPELMQSLLDDFIKLYQKYDRSAVQKDYSDEIRKEIKFMGQDGVERLLEFKVLMRNKDRYNDERPIYHVDILKKEADAEEHGYYYGSSEGYCTNLQYVNNKLVVRYPENVWYHETTKSGNEGIDTSLENDLIQNKQFITEHIKQLYAQEAMELANEWEAEKEAEQER